VVNSVVSIWLLSSVLAAILAQRQARQAAQVDSGASQGQCMQLVNGRGRPVR